MPEYDFTTGTKILLVSTIFLFGGFTIAVLFETTGIFAIIFLVTTLLSLGATYAASVYMSTSSSYQISRFVYERTSDGSAALLFGMAATFFGLFPLILILLSEGWDANVILSAQVGGVGGFLELMGAIKANMEYNE
jgi:hypothetical protein